MGAVFERGHGGPRAITASDVLNDNDWSVISRIAQAGEAALYWDIGDTKQVHLEGTVGTLNLNTDLWVYIIGINHQDIDGITFQGFKTAQTDGVTVTLTDGNYTSAARNGTKYFNLNHWGTTSSGSYNTNFGGWKGCDARYDILGSTNIAPSGYGSTPTTSRVGYDAETTTTTNPVTSTLMSCLPSDLRAVMQPMVVYTDNIGSSSNIATNVTSSVDYLPLLAEFEIFGTRSYANTYEQNNQRQYTYYSAGNPKINYRHTAYSSTAIWWTRSPYYSSASSFCTVNINGTVNALVSRISYGLSPVFRV